MKHQLQEKTRKVFKGLDETDYLILEFFHANAPATRYDAKEEFNSKTRNITKKQPQRISRSTLYRRANRLYELGFLRKVGEREFKTGEKTSLFDTNVFKGHLAVLGCENIDLAKHFEAPPDIGSPFLNAFKPMEQYHLVEKVLDVLVDSKIDLTEREVDLAALIWLAFTKRPEAFRGIVQKIGRKAGFRNSRQVEKDLVKIMKFMKKQFKM